VARRRVADREKIYLKKLAAVTGRKPVKA